MKKILGLDLGTTSIGWAFVKEAENNDEQSSIEKIGVRVNPLSTDEQTDFEKGKSITINADRTLKRGARRNLQRFKQRRENLIEALKEIGFIDSATCLAEEDKNTTHSTFKLRSKAAKEQIEKTEFARVLLMINKKRGYKSSRKAKNEDEGQAIDGMAIAKTLYDDNLTPGQYSYQLLQSGKKYLPDYYRSDLQVEFDKVWMLQSKFYPEYLTDEFRKEITGKGQKATAAIFGKQYSFYPAEIKGTRDEKKLKGCEWRVKAISHQLDIKEVAFVFAEINNNLNNSSGYLGAISDRSKELYFGQKTIGQYLYNQLQHDPHTRMKNQVFYRQDYLDEFEKIWETQALFYHELTPKVKADIRDIIIFYQRRLKSQKALISFCELENEEIEVEVEGKKKTKLRGSRVIPKSCPLFQEFKIWQNLNHLEIKNIKTKAIFSLTIETKEQLFKELNIRGNITKKEALTIITDKPTEFDLNFATLEGNRTNQALYEAFLEMMLQENEEMETSKFTTSDLKENVIAFFEKENINKDILDFDTEIEGKEFEKQPSYLFWHLLYSYESDNSNTGNDKLLEKLQTTYGFKKQFAQVLSNIAFQPDYGSLSAKAIRKVLPFMKAGHPFSGDFKKNGLASAKVLAGYKDSPSLTKEENDNRDLKESLKILSKGSLRNPVVEKILNQMVNVINTIIADPTLGKPDEIRIELARELKKSNDERKEMTTNINAAKLDHDKFRKILSTEFGIKNPTRNDIIRYKLYEELKNNGYKEFYTNSYVPKEKLFSKEYDIEHIIPKARLFDDSFSNKTLAPRQINLNKKDRTAYDFILNDYGEEKLNEFLSRIEMLSKLKDGEKFCISKTKYKKLLMKVTEIGEGFIDRDLRDSQYIAKKAKQMLEEVCRNVTTTTGSITDRLREDWDLINVMQELNFDKYKKLGLTEMIEKKDGSFKERIKDWTKRNDHRHHAMDALTVAFTKHSHVQYLNNLNARCDENNKKHTSIAGIEQKETYKDADNKRKFKAPMVHFREEAKKHLENTLVSFKAKNKVVTKNKNITKVNGKRITKIELTPRGQLHKETVYGKLQQYNTKEEKINAKFDEAAILKVAKPAFRSALLKRLKEFNQDPKLAFTGKNSLDKNPIYVDIEKAIIVPEKVKVVWLEGDYSIRKDITPDLKIEKVIDIGIRNILQKRLEVFKGNAKEAFSNLDKNPIWQNKEKGICIKRVAISGIKNAEALHNKKDHHGKEILNENGQPIPVDFVSSGNNHHVAIYKDEKGELQESIVSFYEAVERVNQSLPIIDKTYNEAIGWQFLFTMKQNEYFIFPSLDFDPSEIDLMNPANNKLISSHLFRVQKIATKNYFFRHHLETTVEERKELRDISYKPQLGLNALNGIIKVRINHIGQVVKVGEY
jgi:CRISPR-associated endonuclease Csn1